MVNIADGFTPGFEHEAKVVNDEMFRTSALMSLCMDNHIQPRSLTEEKLLQLGVHSDKLPLIRPVIAKKILEYYGIQAWEMKNPKRVDQSGMTQEHYDFISRSLSIEGCFNKFLRMNCGDRTDHDGDATQYDKMIGSFGTPETASQKVIVVNQEEVDTVLRKRFERDLERIEKELIKPNLNEKTLKSLEESKSILENKLKELHENNPQRDGEPS